jgi:asparagine synthase (glutamine-hydrolysing)
MCGIGGIIHKSDNVIDITKTNKQLSIMQSHQNRRGPDHSETYNNKNVFLFHNRLSIIDTSDNGNQPMTYQNLTIVFNGEIYNANELRDNHLNYDEFIGHSDTEILLHLIYTYGIEFTLDNINGMFAFCVLDNITGDIYLVRDRTGQKPLYYHISNDTLYFASNPASIVKALPEFEWKLNYEAVWEYLVMGGIFSENTLFNEIKRLDVASVLKYNNGIINNTKYWEPKYNENITDEDIENIIIDSIQKVRISDVPVGLYLSGGIDSSLVASVLGNINGIHLSSNEVSYAELVANKLNISLNIIEPADFDITKILYDYTDFSGEPTMAGFIPYVTSKYASNNYKVAISANGADELFFGYNRTPTPNVSNSVFNNLSRRANLAINHQSLTPNGQIFHIFRNPKSFSVLNLEYKNSENHVLELINKYVPKLDSKFPVTSNYRWMEIMTYIRGDLNPTLDFASMANSIEMRCPFLDHRLIEASLSLDETRHIDNNFGRKKYLKKMLSNYGYSESMWNREKLGFSLKPSYLHQIENLKNLAVDNLQKCGLLNIKINNGSRDAQYLRSAALGLYYWKLNWIDSGIVKL